VNHDLPTAERLLSAAILGPAAAFCAKVPAACSASIVRLFHSPTWTGRKILDEQGRNDAPAGMLIGEDLCQLVFLALIMLLFS